MFLTLTVKNEWSCLLFHGTKLPEDKGIIGRTQDLRNNRGTDNSEINRIYADRAIPFTEGVQTAVCRLQGTGIKVGSDCASSV